MTNARAAVAIVGCGRIAGIADTPSPDGPVATHAQAFTRHPRFSLDAICEPDAKRRGAFKATWNVPRVYETLDELLRREHPAVVSICSATDRHFEQISTLLSAPGVAVVLAEKPVCTNPTEMASLRTAASRPGAPRVVVNHSRRFDPAHRRAAALIRSGALGAPIAGRCDYYGGWLHNGSHLVDTLRMLVGEVTVETARPGAPGHPGDVCLDVRLRAGHAPIDCIGFDETHYQLFEIDLRFESGRIVLRDFGAEIVVERLTTNAIDERFLARAEGSPWAGLASPMAEPVAAIAAALDGKEEDVLRGASLDEAAKTMGVLWQALERV